MPRMEDLVRGWQAACDVCEVSWGGGETPALAGVVAPGSIDLAASCVGIVPSRAHLTLGAQLHAGDSIVLLGASGIHANGVSLARKLAQSLPQGYATRMSSGRQFGEAVLDPTVLYPPVFKALWAADILPHYCVKHHRSWLAQADAPCSGLYLSHARCSGGARSAGFHAARGTDGCA
ncbi:MAG: hypothetical protein WDM77_15065 [Steroidobacteraceae bacterium]